MTFIAIIEGADRLEIEAESYADAEEQVREIIFEATGDADSLQYEIGR